MPFALYRSTRLLGLAASLVVFTIACQSNIAGPAAPSPSGATSGPGLAASPGGGHAIRLVAEPGSVPPGGSGMLNGTETSRANDFEVTVNVHGAPPDTDLYFQIVGDLLPATRGDGVCPGTFPSPPVHAGGDDGILHTSAGGSASTHIKFPIAEGGALGAFEPGVKSDFKYRVVSGDGTFDLRSECVVLTGK